MATVFSTKDPNPGVWFKFNEDDQESGEISIRALNQERRSEIQKRCVKKREKFKHGQRFEILDTDDELFSEMVWDYSIVSWDKLEDDDGRPLICDTETKLFLMKNNVGFAQFVNNCLTRLNEEEEDRVTMIKKNLSSGSKESKKSQIAKDASS